MPSAQETLAHVKLKAANYKCFGPGGTGFDEIKPVNLIVGRNNSGKSALIDVVEWGLGKAKEDIYERGHEGEPPTLRIEMPLSRADLVKVFPKEVKDLMVHQDYLWSYAEEYADKEIGFALVRKHLRLLRPEALARKGQRDRDYGAALAETVHQHLRLLLFRRIASDRDVRPEPQALEDIGPNGDGATGAIVSFINDHNRPERLVEETMLGDLNRIFAPDCRFTELRVQHVGNQVWELFLAEAAHGRIRLSDSGSGLKTVILVLANLHLAPRMNARRAGEYVFGFEELENNLHPSLQRRLFGFLRDFAVNNGCVMFLTSHSNVVVDLYAGDKNVQILQVMHDRREATVRRVEGFESRVHFLEDIGARPSDVLQANCLLWVEGPSDRVYLKHWVKCWSKGELEEGVHYQVMPYGGDSIRHFSGAAPDEVGEGPIPILALNPHPIFICDRDKTADGHRLKSHVERVCEEVKRMRGLAWITDGNEIENYVPVEAIERARRLREKLPAIGRDDDFDAYLEEHTGKGMGSKVAFARGVCKSTSREDLEKDEQLAAWLDKLCDKIRGWNRMPGESAAG